MKKTLLVSILALAACGGDDDKHSDASVLADLSASGPDMLILDTLTPREFDGPADGGASMGSPLTVEATACWAEHPEIACATGYGALSIPFPAAPSATSGELDFALLVTADGHLGSTILQRELVGTQELGGSPYLFTNAYATKLFTSTGFTYPSATTGFIAGGVYSDDNALSGLTVSITPASGKIVYFDTDGTLNPSLNAGTGSGFVIGNVTPGAFTLTFSAPGKTCSNPPTLLPNPFPSTVPQSVGGYVGANSLVSGVTIECD